MSKDCPGPVALEDHQSAQVCLNKARADQVASLKTCQEEMDSSEGAVNKRGVQESRCVHSSTRKIALFKSAVLGYRFREPGSDESAAGELGVDKLNLG